MARYYNYNRRKSYSTTPPWARRSYGGNPDAGANDEGFYQAWCSSCQRKTEHDPCSGCCSCPSRSSSR